MGQGPSALHCVLSEGSFWSWMGQGEIGRVVPVLCHQCQGKTQLGIKLKINLKSHRDWPWRAMLTQDEDWVNMWWHISYGCLLAYVCVCIQEHICASVCTPMWRSANNLRCYYSGHIPLGFVCLSVCLVSWLVGLFFETRSV